MPPQFQNLRHDLTALYTFVDSISSSLQFRTSSEAYTPAAVRFFDFVEKLATVTKAHVAAWAVSDEEEFEDRREELGTIRAAWKELHKFIKPALDADTLHIPSAVVDGIVRRFRETPKYSKTEFAIFHTSEFNYVQVRTADLRRVAGKIKLVIPGAPDFPVDLGLIGIPYSQGTTAFANCLLAHEIGHFVYRDGNLETVLQAEIGSALKSLMGTEEQKNKERLDVSIKVVSQWAEEIFCDLFGVLLVGPCYTYAYLDAFDLAAILDSNGALSPERMSPRLEFYDLYPSEVFRIQQQAELLRGSRWWDHIAATPSHLAALLSPVRELKEEDHLKQNSKTERLVKALFSVLPEIKKAVGEALSKVEDGFTAFIALNAEIQNYLSNGVVPSSLNIKTGINTEDISTVHPAPIVLLNSGMEFYLTKIDKLMESIPGEKPGLFERRLHWVRRIEEWVEKAIEDEYIMRETSDGGTVSS